MPRATGLSSANGKTDHLIRDAFITLYQTKSLDKITISEISEKAHISRGTFYLHYEDIYALLHSIEDELIQNIIQYMQPVVQQTVMHSQIDNFRADYVQMLDYIKSEKTYFKAVLFGSDFAHFTLKYSQSIENTFSISLNMDKQTSSEIVPYVCSFFSGAITTLVKHWIVTDFSLSSQEVATLVYQALFMGLMNSAF